MPALDNAPGLSSVTKSVCVLPKSRPAGVVTPEKCAAAADTLAARSRTVVSCAT
jgi:hypothetical protein